MGQVIIQRNPLNVALNETAEHEGPLIDWVVERFPAGFPAKTLLTFNGGHLELRDMDRAVGPDDEVYLLMEPAAPVAAVVAAAGGISALLTTAAVGAAVSFGLSYVANWLRGTPDAAPGQGERETPSPTYSLSLPANRARLGEALPVVYGTAKVVPDIVAQPYRFYLNATTYPEYTFVMLSIGRGVHEFDREDIFIGDSSIGDRNTPLLDHSVIDYKSFPPTRHNNTWGVIQQQCLAANSDGMGGNDGQPNGDWESPPFYEDVETSIEIDNQELRFDNIVGNYVANRVGSSTDHLQVDVEFPQGLYNTNTETGAPTLASVGFGVFTHQIDDNDNDVGGSTTTWNFTVTLATTSPVRRTITIPGGAGTLQKGRYRVSMRRSSLDSTKTTQVDRSYWTGLRAVLTSAYANGSPVPEYQDVYEYMHLVVFRIKATEGIARDAANRISINARRVLYTAGEVYTNNPGDVMVDMFTNEIYGAKRPLSELDTVKLDALRTKWATSADGFNAVYDRATAVWPAMQQAARIGDSAPVVHGGVVTVAEDIYKLDQHFFTPSNIVDGSVSTTYAFNDTTEYDCYEVEYLDPGSFIPEYVRYPTYGVIPLQVRYFGCTNQRMAEHQAQFLWFKRTFRRKRVSFKTEALGNLPLVGDKINVEHPVVTTTPGGESYLVETISPESQFSVTIEAIIDNFVYSPIPQV